MREIRISRLLGHGTLPKRHEMLEAHPWPVQKTGKLEKPSWMRQVSEDEFRKHGDGQARTGMGTGHRRCGLNDTDISVKKHRVANCVGQLQL